MRFAENNRISHRQLYRQIVLTFSAPFLLCLFGEGKIMGITGILAVVISGIFLSVYVLFLIRQESCYTDLEKYAGGLGAGLIGVFFLVYIVLTAAYLLQILGEIVPKTLVTDVSGNWIMLFAAVACGLGTHKGMQRRGRVADVMGGIFLIIIAVIIILCVTQGKLSYLDEMTALSGWNTGEFIRDGYGMLCAFSGISLLPFLLEYVEKSGSAWRPTVKGIFTIVGIVVSMQLLLAAILGWNRINMEKYPVLPLLAGADLPGNVLARFDVLWMAFLLFSLLFALGSMMHYGHLLIRKTNLGSGKYWLMALMYFLAVFQWDGRGIADYYGDYLAYFFVPVLLVFQIIFMLMGKEKKKKRMSAVTMGSLLVLMFVFTGCGGVEPEKRIFPLAMGVDFSEERFTVTYGMADLPEATGQNKPEEGGEANTLSIQGKDFSEIEENYNRSQEKYLDLGHLEILVLGTELISGKENLSEIQEILIQYLKNQPFIGEDIYIFQAEKPEELVGWRTEKGTSLGEYVTGIMENRMNGQKEKGVTLRELYYQVAKEDELPELPTIIMGDKTLEIFWV